MYLLLLFMIFTVFDFLAITEIVNVTNISQYAVPSAYKSITYISNVCERSLSLLHWEQHQFDLRGCKLYTMISYFALNWEKYNANILELYNSSTINTHTLTVIHGILKLRGKPK